jgi:hypothetical protein
MTPLESAILEIRAVCQRVLGADKLGASTILFRESSPALAQMLLDWIDGEAESHMEMWEKQIIACAEELRRLGC